MANTSITMVFQCNNGVLTTDPPECMTVPRALYTLLLFHLGYGGQIIEQSPTRIVARSSFFGRTDVHTFTGSPEDIAKLTEACKIHMHPRSSSLNVDDLITTASELRADALRNTVDALNNSYERGGISMLVACGILDPLDPIRGIALIKKLNADKHGWGMRLIIDLLELFTEQKILRFSQIVDQVGV
jgi:hypothetical protein